jgi:cytochrome c oxidase subunit 2
MNAGFRLFPERASTIGGEVDALFLFLLGVSVFFVTLIAGSILFFAVRYRRSHRAEYPQPIVGLLKLEIFWSVVPLMLTLVMFAWGADIFFRVQTPPREAMEISVVGKQWMWKAEHPSGQREINELHVPAGRPVTLRLISEDVIHSFYVPAFRLKEDVLPGRYTTLWFEATEPGDYHLFCAEYCGTKHSEMVGRVVVLNPADYQRWLAGRLDVQPTSLRGEWAFQRLACQSCHGASDDVRRGPALAGRFGEPVQLSNGQTETFDAAYVRESILKPQEKLVAGYPAIMPTYQGQISESEILAIIDYLKSRQARAMERDHASGPVQAPLPEESDGIGGGSDSIPNARPAAG